MESGLSYGSTDRDSLSGVASVDGVQLVRWSVGRHGASVGLLVVAVNRGFVVRDRHV